MRHGFPLALGLVFAFASVAAAQPPPPVRPDITRPPGPPSTVKDIDHAIAFRVDSLMNEQKPDGHWEYSNYPMGMTALAALALKHSNDPRAATSVAKAVDYISQQPVEYKTYSAGMVLSLIYQMDPRIHSTIIGRYAGPLVKSQRTDFAGMYSYDLAGIPKPGDYGKGDNSNTQFAVLGLLFAERSGYQVPRSVWEKLRDHYVKTQNKDGGWGYTPTAESTKTMTIASTISLHIAEEQLQWGASLDHCVMGQPSRATEAGMKWISDRFSSNLNPYGLYALERLGILTGLSEFGGHYWYPEGANMIINGGIVDGGPGTGLPGTAFLVLFLSRGREPIIVNKLKYYGDWNNNSYDVKHLVDYISDRMQSPMQWRIATLQSKLEELQKVPILYFNGIKGPAFTDDEKIKLREYVMRGGVLLVQACRAEKGNKEFDESFRALMEECFPESALKPLQFGHPVFITPRKITKIPKIEVITFKERIGVFYLPGGLCVDWQREGASAKPSLDVGVNIVFFVLKQSGRLPTGVKPETK